MSSMKPPLLHSFRPLLNLLKIAAPICTNVAQPVSPWWSKYFAQPARKNEEAAVEIKAARLWCKIFQQQEGEEEEEEHLEKYIFK